MLISRVDAFPTRTFHGKVVQVRNAPITVQNVVTYDTVIGVNNADLKFKPGMTANVSIIIAHKDDVLKITNAALRYRPADAPTPERRRRVKIAAALAVAGRAGRRATAIARFMFCDGSEPSQCKSKPASAMESTTEVLEGLQRRRSCDYRPTQRANAATSRRREIHSVDRDDSHEHIDTVNGDLRIVQIRLRAT